jgi:hypothetical protein
MQNGPPARRVAAPLAQQVSLLGERHRKHVGRPGLGRVVGDVLRPSLESALVLRQLSLQTLHYLAADAHRVADLAGVAHVAEVPSPERPGLENALGPRAAGVVPKPLGRSVVVERHAHDPVPSLTVRHVSHVPSLELAHVSAAH